MSKSPFIRRLQNLAIFIAACTFAILSVMLVFGIIGAIFVLIFWVAVIVLGLAIASWIAASIFGETRVKAALSRIGIDLEDSGSAK